MGTGDWTHYRTERNEILDLVRRENLAGFASLAGDRHAFAAGLLSTALPPSPLAPVGLEFVVSSISAGVSSSRARRATWTTSAVVMRSDTPIEASGGPVHRPLSVFGPDIGRRCDLFCRAASLTRMSRDIADSSRG
jgi:alkaline phosphatase D